MSKYSIYANSDNIWKLTEEQAHPTKTFFPFSELVTKKLNMMTEAIISAHFEDRRRHIDCVSCITHFLCAQYHRSHGRRDFSVQDLPLIFAGAALHDINEGDATAPATGTPKGTAGLEWLFRECNMTEREKKILSDICLRHLDATPLAAKPIYVQIVELAEVYTLLSMDAEQPLSHAEAIRQIRAGFHGHFAPDLLECLPRLEVEFRALHACSDNHHRIHLLQNIYRGDCRFYWLRKRTLDIFLSFFGLLLLSPLLLLICLLIVLDDPHGGPFFKQTRVGRHQKHFSMYKFRTMFVDAEARKAELESMNEKDGPVFKIANDPRITRIGRFLRKTSMDELPQLINVLKGEMTLVGPRPPIPSEVAQYSDYDKMRLSVTPGLTCVWQVQPNRDAIRFERWVDLDLAYIGTRSLSLDVQLFFKTVLAVFRRSGS